MFLGFSLFGLLAIILAFYLTISVNETDKLTTMQIKQILDESNLLLESPIDGDVLLISKPSDEINFQWLKINHPKIKQEILNYDIKIYSTGGDFTFQNTSKENNLSVRNFSVEGKYVWKLTPKYNGVLGETVSKSFIIKHPENRFQQVLKSPLKVNASVERNGEVKLEAGIDKNKISWADQYLQEEEKFLIQISENDKFQNPIKQLFVKNKSFDWDIFKTGKYFFRVTIVSPFNELKSSSNVVEVNVDVRSALPKMAFQNKNVFNFFEKVETKEKYSLLTPLKETNSRKPASVESAQETIALVHKWYIPKELTLNIGQGSINYKQSSETTDAKSDFTLQNIGFNLLFQNHHDLYFNVDGLMRSSAVQNSGEFIDNYFSIAVGRNWDVGLNSFSFFTSIGAKYSNVNFFEQNFENDVDSKQQSILSATAQLGVVAPMGKNFLNKLRIIIDLGKLNQVGIKYDGRYLINDSTWFTEISGGYYNGVYKLTDEFNQKQIDRSEMQLYFGVGKNFQ